MNATATLIDPAKSTYENKDVKVVSVCAIGLTFTTIFVGLRCYVRIFLVRHFCLDDWTTLWALVRSHLSLILR
jgi:hypothetical protein